MALNFGLFCAVMGGGPFDNYQFAYFTHTRAPIYVFYKIISAALIPIKPTRSVGWGDIGSY